MPLLRTWAPYFKSHARQHGRKDYHAHGVKRLTPDEGELVRAAVTCDDQTHTVTFRSDGTGTTASCDCPQTGGGSFCQHIWAALMAIQHSDEQFATDTADLANPRPPKARKRPADQEPRRPTEPLWSTRLDLLRPTGLEVDRSAPTLQTPYQACYVIRPTLSTRHGRLVVELRQRQPTLNGYSRPTRLKINQKSVEQIPDLTDRELCAILLGAEATLSSDEDLDVTGHDPLSSLFILPKSAQRGILSQMIRTGRCFIDDADEATPLSWNDDKPWVLWMVAQHHDEQLVVNLELRRDDDKMRIDEPDLLLAGAAGLVIYGDQAAPFDDQGAHRWVSHFANSPWSTDETSSIAVASQDIERFLDRLYLLPQLPGIDLPKGVGRPETQLQPTPHLELIKLDITPATPTTQRNQLTAKVWFAYGPHRVTPEQQGQFICVATPEHAQAPINATADQKQTGDTPTLIRRDTSFEQQAIASLWPLGFRPHTSVASEPATLWLPRKLMPEAVSELIGQGWIVIADEHMIHAAQAPVLSVTSGIDWFELRGSFRYQTAEGEQEVPLPEVLAAARAGKSMLTLNDGSQGMLPQEWMNQNGLLAAIGKIDIDHLRFKSSQAVILDSLLSRQATISVDEKFDTIRDRLKQCVRIAAADPAPTFQGQLRSYQREGLGWLRYLQMLTVGGILADDMGLGKTVQVLAMLHELYNRQDNDLSAGQHAPPDLSGDAPDAHRPSLIVVPRSIVFNWIDEASRFSPKLRAQAYTGTDRQALRDVFTDHDVVITSYGTMRRDITELIKHPFEYVILDEAQAIKNPSSQSAKAARLLNSRHRLALTGTPVENHLGDLWSIFEFLNAGMLGSNTRFAQLIRGNWQGGRSRQARIAGETKSTRDVAIATPKAQRAAQIARAMKPFILRRTKQQVLKDLPEKTEQTILCQMEPAQRKIYDQLLGHYRSTLLDRRTQGVGSGSVVAPKTMMVLEALLRLRQAACHPGLIDPSLADASSAKLDVLLDRIEDLIEEKHKALIFSQFTSMLALVRKKLDERGIIYEYLDGKTRNRGDRVERFQTDPYCPLFLISLKAGGLGLNLTAAGYVFILDPWWNPAVEAQAIDRTHRIGQTRPVFAYRLICQDTVEQRIAQLQDKKRKLADAIIGGQENLLRTLTGQDLQYLLS